MGGSGTSGAKYNWKTTNIIALQLIITRITTLMFILHIFTILNKNLTHHFTFNSGQLNAL